MKKIITTIVIATAFLSCTSSKNNDLSLRIQIDAEPPTLDWNLATDTTSRAIILNLMDPLLGYTWKDDKSELKGILVNEWSSNKNFTTWDIHINPEAKWSDGTKLEAKHVSDSFERLLNPKTAAFNSYHYFVIKNAKDYNEGKLKDFSKVGIKVVSPEHLQFQLHKSVSYLPKLLAMMNVIPIRKDLIAKYGDDWLRPENFVGAGPYTLEKVKPGEQVVLRTNPNYWGAKPKLEEITFRVIEEASTAMSLYDSGELDVVTSIPISLVSSLVERDDFYRSKDLAIEYIGFNIKKAPGNNKVFRQAIAHGLDRTELVNILQGAYEAYNGFVPEPLLSGELETLPTYNSEMAKQMVKTANLKEPIAVTSYSKPREKMILENLQAQLKDIGIDAELQQQEWKVYLRQVNSNPPLIYRMGWLAIYPDAHMFLSLFTSGSHFNTSGWSNKNYDNLVRKAEATPAGAKRRALHWQAMKLLLKEAVVVPLFSGERHYLVSERVQNFPINPMNRLRLSTTFKYP